MEIRGSVVLALFVAASAVLATPAECAAGSRDSRDSKETKDAKDTKDECLEAHGRGQDLKDKGHLTRAKQVFLTCAQSSCPALVQADCARFGEELAQLVPTVTFGARDARAADLPITTVYVDDVLVATRLDDGKAYELDPGKHVVRYVHDGKETTLKVVLGQGEKGRVLLATFLDPPRRDAAQAAAPAGSVDAFEPAIEPKRNKLPLVVAGLGAAAAATGGVLFGLGMAKVPGGCDVAAKECAAPPGDPSLAQAKSGVSLANTGAALGVTGAVVLVGALVWYFVQPVDEARRASAPAGVFRF
jgi:hypothetical protein